MSLRPCPRAGYLGFTAKLSGIKARIHMSSNSNSSTSFAMALNETIGSRYSYSRKRWDAFSAWQEHIRKLAGSIGSVPFASRDRDLRRTVVPG